jgi:transcriptional regulator with GAF, ATPase, and Fis domain
VPETLLESELFGHEKGAFTGAVTATEGLFEAADGGTVFLDEIGEMPLSTQAKLLRVLENGEMKRVGSVRPLRVDVRVVAATNRDLAERCEAGAFRGDLYFRLAGEVVTIPALRERPQEIEPFADHFARAAARRLGRAAPRLAPGAIAKLRAHDWPGNIRELRNVMERAVLEARCGLVDAGAIKIHPAPRTSRTFSTAPPPGPRVSSEDVEPAAHPVDPLRSDIKALERRRIVVALEACGGNQTQAAKVLGIPRRSLLRRIEEFGLVRPRKGRLGA